MAKIYCIPWISENQGNFFISIPGETPIPLDVSGVENGDMLESQEIFALYESNNWVLKYRPRDYVQSGSQGYVGNSGSPGISTYFVISNIIITRGIPRYGINSWEQIKPIINKLDGRVYEYDANSFNYVENTSKRLNNG